MEVDPRDYLFSRATRAHIVDAYSAGRQVIKNGTLTGVDLSALEDALRAEYLLAFTDMDYLSGIWTILKQRICAHYQGCC